MTKFWSTLLAGSVGGLISLGAAKMLEKPQEAQLSNQQNVPVRQVSYGGTPAPFDFTKAAERAMPTVVHIKTSESREAANQRQRQYGDNPFRYFFGDSFDDQPRSG